jgi:hypothetical protein
MSTTEPTGSRRATRDRPPPGAYTSADDGAGWRVFAGTAIALLAILNLIYGIAAVSNSTFFVNDAKFVFSGLNTLGWVLIVVSVVQGATAAGLFVQNQIARWAGVAIAFINAIVQTIVLPAYPWWSLAIFVVDMFVIYALIVHGGRDRV